MVTDVTMHCEDNAPACIEANSLQRRSADRCTVLAREGFGDGTHIDRRQDRVTDPPHASHFCGCCVTCYQVAYPNAIPRLGVASVQLLPFMCVDLHSRSFANLRCRICLLKDVHAGAVIVSAHTYDVGIRCVLVTCGIAVRTQTQRPYCQQMLDRRTG
jgi:hypothetical protein